MKKLIAVLAFASVLLPPPSVLAQADTVTPPRALFTRNDAVLAAVFAAGAFAAHPLDKYFAPGTIIVFDDFYSMSHEFKAFHHYDISFGRKWKALGRMPHLIKAAIEKAADPGLKALAYNTLGDVYNTKGQKQDAKWAYLWVDVIYNQDPIETNKAVARLADLFADLKDEDRAKKYRDRLRGK